MFPKIAMYINKKASSAPALIAAGLLGANVGASAKKLLTNPAARSMIARANKSGRLAMLGLPAALLAGGAIGYTLAEED